ncbi:MAG TPA: hypothetical protein VJ746_07880 [Nitrospira sp.]|nr:hypothetical protein [Nitrospira sp.]
MTFLKDDISIGFEAALIALKFATDKTAAERFEHYKELMGRNQGKHIDAPRARDIHDRVLKNRINNALALSYVKALEVSGQFGIELESHAIGEATLGTAALG